MKDQNWKDKLYFWVMVVLCFGGAAICLVGFFLTWDLLVLLGGAALTVAGVRVLRVEDP